MRQPAFCTPELIKEVQGERVFWILWLCCQSIKTNPYSVIFWLPPTTPKKKQKKHHQTPKNIFKNIEKMYSNKFRNHNPLPQKNYSKSHFSPICSNGETIILKSFKCLLPNPTKQIKPPAKNLKQIIVLQFNQNGDKIDLQQFQK